MTQDDSNLNLQQEKEQNNTPKTKMSDDNLYFTEMRKIVSRQNKENTDEKMKKLKTMCLEHDS